MTAAARPAPRAGGRIGPSRPAGPRARPAQLARTRIAAMAALPGRARG